MDPRQVALLGDAVHPMTPNIGQGAGMAMEDAAVLAEEPRARFSIEKSLRSYLRAASLGSRPSCASRAKSARTASARTPSAAGSGTGAFAARGEMRRKMQADLERLLAYPA